MIVPSSFIQKEDVPVRQEKAETAQLEMIAKSDTQSTYYGEVFCRKKKFLIDRYE